MWSYSYNVDHNRSAENRVSYTAGSPINIPINIEFLGPNKQPKASPNKCKAPTPRMTNDKPINSAKKLRSIHVRMNTDEEENKRSNQKDMVSFETASMIERQFAPKLHKNS